MYEHIELYAAIVIDCCAAERPGTQRERALCTARRICYGVRPGFCSSGPGQPSILRLSTRSGMVDALMAYHTFHVEWEVYAWLSIEFCVQAQTRAAAAEAAAASALETAEAAQAAMRKAQEEVSSSIGAASERCAACPMDAAPQVECCGLMACIWGMSMLVLWWQ